VSESVSHPERTHLRSRVSGFVGDGFGDFGVWEFKVSGVGVWGVGFGFRVWGFKFSASKKA
jgi:hypothetical protein